MGPRDSECARHTQNGPHEDGWRGEELSQGRIQPKLRLLLICYFIIPFYSYSPTQVKFKFQKFKLTFPSFKLWFRTSISKCQNNSNMNINFIVSNIIICYFPCYVFMEKINGCIRIFFSFFNSMSLFKIGDQVYVFHKMYLQKLSSRESTFLYLFIGPSFVLPNF
jgi:hypothetical protein